jgi:hypothetical protein
MTIDFDQANIRLTKSGQTVLIPWPTVDSVFAFKQDLVAYDRIAMLIKMNDGLEIEMNEDMVGWKELVDALPAHLQNCRDFAEWYFEVAFPPFEPNLTLIYKRLSADQVH